MSSASNSMAVIGRQHFDAETLSAMDEIAALVLAYQSLIGMVATFKNAPELDHEEARPHADAVFEATRQTAAALQKALFAGRRKRSIKIVNARRDFLPVIREAAPHAQWLAETVSRAVGGDEIEVRVLGTLRNIATAWASSSQ